MFKKGLCIILQGIPGSGKSTIAEALELFHSFDSIREVKIFSTDNYYINNNNEYIYDPSKASEYHKKNQLEAKLFMEKYVDGVAIIDNTNITCKQAKPYVEVALANNYDVQFIRVAGPWVNEHGVPETTLNNMRNSMETLTVEKCLQL